MGGLKLRVGLLPEMDEAMRRMPALLRTVRIRTVLVFAFPTSPSSSSLSTTFWIRK